MKVAFFLTDFPILSETFILNQIIGLIDLGVDIDIYASINPKEGKVHPQAEEYKLLERVYYSDSLAPIFKRLTKGLRIVLKDSYKNPLTYTEAIKNRSLRDLFYVKIFLANKSKKSYDIIHAHFGSNGLIGAVLKETGVFRGKLITSFHGYDFSRLINERGSEIYKGLFRIGDLFSANTDFTKGKLVELGCSQNKIVKLPVGIDINFFEFRERHLEDQGMIKLLTVARLVEKKGLEYSIKAVSKIARKYPNIEYNIAGDGILRKRLESLIEKLSVRGKINLLGWKTQEELKRLFKEAHIFILSSVTASDGDMEGQGLVLQEAQAMGLPVLSTLHNGIPEGVLDGQSGFLVPERDVDALVEKVEYLIENPELWSKMGKYGREFVEERYDIQKLNQRLVKIYSALLTNNTDMLEELKRHQ